MSFQAVIPQEFFKAPPAQKDSRNGTITLQGGNVIVGWPRGCPIFNENLAAARDLKNAGHGWYRSATYDWSFKPVVVAEVLKKFPTLQVAPEVEALAKNQPIVKAQAPSTQPVSTAKHGTIVKKGSQYLVCWGGAFSCPSNAFGQYLAAARKIKEKVIGSQGYKASVKGWSFAVIGAGRVVQAYPEPFFEHSVELIQDAKKYPVPAEVPHEVAQGEDALAGKLIEAADKLLASL